MLVDGNLIFNDTAIKQFVKRKQNPPQQIENSKLHAGKPMYFYCQHCGHLADVLPEDYLFVPRRICTQCKGLESHGILDEVKVQQRELVL